MAQLHILCSTWFRQRFAAQTPSFKPLSIVDTVNERIKENYNRPIRGRPFWHVTSCNDVLCFVESRIHVCNLSTREEATLPYSSHRWGTALGYSSRADEFKLVQWFMDTKDGYLRCCGYQIFSLTYHLEFKSDSWKLIETIPYMKLCEKSASVDGAIYKMIYNRENGKNFNVESILAFDLDKEKSKIISCPKLARDANASLVELKECLYLAHSWNQKAVVKMWRLKIDDWVSEYYINVPSISKTIVPLTIVGSEDNVEKIVFLALRQGGRKGLLYYDVQTGTMREPHNLSHLKVREVEFPCVLRYI